MADAPASPAGGSHESGGDQSPRSNVREQDRYLPIANISRIMKKALPANGKIAKDAKDTVQECVSEFISFITSEASDKCQKEKRKTINGDDLLWAMATLGFEDYIDPLKAYLTRYREGDTKGSARSGDGSSKKDAVGAQLGPNAQAQGQQSSCFSHARHKVRGDPDVLVVVAVAAAAAVVVERTWRGFKKGVGKFEDLRRSLKNNFEFSRI
ncbi:hypothetical protein HYC85_013210 [Camellia sinensis]|uniref:Transcription factor CBF/NF-Y/archaeal histone domain-containing protein n=1 Tax=Camellia sinensis TaxID=4442 RepID=A0A7J7H2R4_CAMSI|nr:hypothetical protein HYC85_013210 [Camellia sinensis]